ncbi:hypothetical protein ANN_12676 [Periplaneta americana]|uniref:Uncharacterized protein n=1 Tax=Periplaneta americana TaxID=6978 RepID=A0ABQ8THE6_PERAM|nr:hypothetical protein ANN_12676 [Periplaneta americana]
MEWHHANSPKKYKFKSTPSAGNVMATVFFDSEGLLLVDIMPHGTTINSAGPELAPCDYHLFGKLKDPFAERGSKMTPLCTLLKSGSYVLVQTFTVLVYRPSFIGYQYFTVTNSVSTIIYSTTTKLYHENHYYHH